MKFQLKVEMSSVRVSIRVSLGHYVSSTSSGLLVYPKDMPTEQSLYPTRPSAPTPVKKKKEKHQ